MGEIMQFPETVEEFMQQYKITDTQQVYTNGTELVPIFRMKQWFEAHKRRWIPCSERLPEICMVNNEMVNYLAYLPYFGNVDIANYHPDLKQWLCYGLPVSVSHWQPLPEPPEEGGARNAVD